MATQEGSTTMHSASYDELVKSVSIKQLTDFLKDQTDLVTIDNWADVKAPAKRALFMEALAASMEFRKKFVDHVNAVTNPTTKLDWTAMENGPEPDMFPDGDTPETDATETVEAGEIVEEPAKAEKATKAEKGSAAHSEIVTHTPGKTGQFVEDAFSSMIADAAGLDAEQSKAAVRHAEEDLEFEHMRLGVLLNHISQAQHYLTLGYDNMREYLAAETGLHYRKAMQLIQNAVVVKELGIPAKNLKGVTWAALRHVLPVINQSNYKTWLDAARSMKHVSLIAAVNEEKTKQAGALPKPDSKPEDKQVSQKIFTVYPDQKAVIDAAIEKAKLEGNTDQSGAALEVIAAAYTASPVSASSMAQVLPDLTNDGLLKMFTKINADEGVQGLMRVMEVIGEVWPDVQIDVDLGKVASVA